ncbi:3348_t:CDS:1, partial [Funneliformis geosporum]
THGLPIEHKVLQLFSGEEKVLRKKCDEYASQQVKIQKKQLAELGLFTDYDQIYLTKDKKYEAEQIRVFGEMVKKGLIYQGWKPVYWSCSHATALAEAEVEYLPKEGYSFYFYLPLVDSESLWGVKQ